MAVEEEQTPLESLAGSITGEIGPEELSPQAAEAVDVAVDLPRIERAVREILAAVGEDPNREGLRETRAKRRWTVSKSGRCARS